ncbi:MAG: hypothetical protein SV377_04080 [Halobacteria archaeon]|nr:hypothetical protein [Halobacteria archaeon]
MVSETRFFTRNTVTTPVHAVDDPEEPVDSSTVRAKDKYLG